MHYQRSTPTGAESAGKEDCENWRTDSQNDYDLNLCTTRGAHDSSIPRGPCASNQNLQLRHHFVFQLSQSKQWSHVSPRVRLLGAVETTTTPDASRTFTKGPVVCAAIGEHRIVCHCHGLELVLLRWDHVSRHVAVSGSVCRSLSTRRLMASSPSGLLQSQTTASLRLVWRDPVP